MTIRDISVAFGFEIDQSSEAQAESSIKGIKNLAGKLLGAIAVVFSVKGTTELVEAAADAQALKSQFTQVFGDMKKEASQKLKAISNDTGVAVNRMKGSFSQIASFSKTTGLSQSEALDIANRSMIAVTDSAAFYDRSIEEVTDTMQSFLKGNYENDAALGLSCTETTRNIAANSLYGKSFKDLSEAEKQFTLLKMVEDANKASGALGQAARESDTWTNQLGNLQQAFVDLKAAAGDALLKPAVVVLKVMIAFVNKATAAIQNLTSKNGLLTKVTEKYHALIKRLHPAIDRMTQTLSNGLNKGISVAKDIVDRFGGVKNVLKLLSIIAGAFVLAMNWGKIISGASAFISLIKGVGKLFSGANLKVLGLVAIIVILALIVEDFIQFMLGNDSVIGTVFDKAGIGADNARQAIFDAFNKVKTFITKTWTAIKTAIEKHGGSIKKSVKNIFDGIVTVVSTIFENLVLIAGDVFSGLADIIGNVDLSSPINAVVSTIDVLLGVLGSLGKYLTEHKDMVDKVVKAYAAFKLGSVVVHLGKLAKAFTLATAAKVRDIAETVYLKALYAKDFVVSLAQGTAALVRQAAQFTVNTAAKIADAVAQGAMTAATVAWNAVCTVATAVTTALGAAFTFLTSPIGLVVLAIAAVIAIGVLLYKNWDKVKEVAETVWNALASFFAGVLSGIQQAFLTALSFIKSIWTTVWNAISSFFKNIWNGILSFVRSAGATIRNVISGAMRKIQSVVRTVLTSVASFFKSTFSGISSFVSSTFNNIVSGVRGAVGRVKSSIVNGFSAAINWIKKLPSQSLKWGSDIIDGIVKGIQNSIGKVAGAVKGVADKIKSFLHFSVPDEGPLTDYESWMPDFMGGLADGISSNEDIVLDKVKELAGGISILMKGATASAATAAGSQISNRTSNMTQNVSINNSYSGGSMEAQKTVSKAMKKSAVDVTTQMARGLAYARG